MNPRLPDSSSPRKKYVLGDFTKYSTGKLAAQFLAISEIDLYGFSEKIYVDEGQNLHRDHMVLVGHYSRRSGGPPVWAQATGEEIRYHQGTGIQVKPLLLDIHSSKVYYDPPFSHMGGTVNNSDARPGMTQERKLERAIVESVIQFVFLMSSRLNHTLDRRNPDLLGSFRFALKNFFRYREAHQATHHFNNETSIFVAGSTIAPSGANPVQIVERSHENCTPKPSQRPQPPTALVPRKRTFIDLTRTASESSSEASDRHNLTQEHSDDCAKLKRKVQDLKAKLKEQETRMSTIEAKLVREKDKRKRAREKLEIWKDEHEKQQDISRGVISTVQLAEYGKDSEDCNNMLLDQNRKLEDFRSKCIAHQEEKIRWNTQMRALTEKISKQRQQLARCQATERENKLQNAARQEATREQAEELAREKEARIFWQRILWQRKHNNLSKRLLNRSQPPATSAPPDNQKSDMVIVRTTSSRRGA